MVADGFIMPSDAWAVEDDDGHSNRAFTKELFETSDMFPSADGADRVMYASLGCGHTNTALEQCNQEVPTDLVPLKGGGEEGRINSKALWIDDPGLEDACRRGLTWKILGRSAEATYPGLCEILMDAVNIKAKAQRPDSQFQILSKVHAEVLSERHSIRMPDGTVNVKWDEILKVVAATKPTCIADLPAIVNFYKKWSGGAKSPFVAEMAVFSRMHVPSRQSLPKFAFSTLAGMPVDVVKVGELSHIVHAAMKCMALSPNTACTKVGQSECSKFFSQAELGSLHEKPLVFTADAILKECRVIAQKERCPPHVFNKLTGAP